MKTIGEPCILEDRLCTDCGECDLCDLDPGKRCDNCCRCLETLDGDFAEIGIDDILINNEEGKTKGARPRGQSYKIKR